MNTPAHPPGAPVATEEVHQSPPPVTDPWQQRITAFSTAVNKPAEEIVTALMPLVGQPGNEAASALSDPEAVHDEDLVAALVKDGPKIPLGIFRKNLSKLRGAPPALVNTGKIEGQTFEALPPVPEDSSFLEMLKIGGVLRVGPTEVISAMKAGIAESLGLYNLPDHILEKMEIHAETLDEPVGESFFKLRTMVTKKNYGEILSVLGVEGSFCSERRKREFLGKLNNDLWPALRNFHRQLMSWQEAWTAGAANPGMILTALAFGQSGRGMMPPGMLQAPDTASIRDEAEAFINKINRTFAGVAIPIARALAYDATRIKGFLEDPNLPVAVGAVNKDQMLRELGIAIGADYVRLERNVTRYALAVMELKNVSAGNEEYGYLGSMIQLGAAIPWAKLPGGGSSAPASPARPGASRLHGGRGNGTVEDEN